MALLCRRETPGRGNEERWASRRHRRGFRWALLEAKSEGDFRERQLRPVWYRAAREGERERREEETGKNAT
ncbi:hypothetical protein E2C01_102577 [Portunus trituberculatus]|uniref:Uncharacterized protein n=1 Tax=Portunus trituberculatus TaxID=210409 RepID=A0A5B7KHN3_PORTR|nr:hypothetical protein [Portunus trituberculatus]